MIEDPDSPWVCPECGYSPTFLSRSPSSQVSGRCSRFLQQAMQGDTLLHCPHLDAFLPTVHLPALRPASSSPATRWLVGSAK